MKYTISEFAKEIRKLYPGDYDDLTDSKLVELWLKKYPKDIDKVDLNKKETINSSDYFSFRGIIASAFFAYIAYYFHSLANLGNSFYNFINEDKIASIFLLNTFNKISEGNFDKFLSFFHFWLWLLFLSFVIKTIFCLRHAFITPKNNVIIVGSVGVVFDILPLFLFFLKYKSMEDAMSSILFYIPTIIGMLFLYRTEDFNTENQIIA
jgi:hypothetical protein